MASGMTEKPDRDQPEETVRGVAEQDAREEGNGQEGRGKDVKAKVFAGILLLLALVLIGVLVDPFIHVIVFASILAFLLEPVRKRLESALHGRRNLTAMAMTLAAGLLIVIPVLLLLWVFFLQAADVVGRIQQWIDGGEWRAWFEALRSGAVGTWLETHSKFVPEGWMNVEARLPEYFENAARQLFELGRGFASGLVVGVSHFFMMMFILFFLVRDGRSMLRGLRSLSPLAEKDEDRILDHVSKAAHAVVVGNLLTALSQGLVGGVGLAVVGLPGLVLGALMGLASLVPLLGTGLVSVPAILWLAATQQWISAAVFTAWVLILVSPIDNYLRPYFMRGAGARSTFFVFIAILGGIAHFGISGIVFGPLILALAVALIEVYRHEFAGEVKNKGSG